MLVGRGENEIVTPRSRRSERGSVGIDRGTYAQIGGVKARQARRRYEFAHQSTTAIVNSGNAAVVVEDLRVANMTRSAKGTLEKPGVHVNQKAG